MKLTITVTVGYASPTYDNEPLYVGREILDAVRRAINADSRVSIESMKGVVEHPGRPAIAPWSAEI